MYTKSIENYYIPDQRVDEKHRPPWEFQCEFPVEFHGHRFPVTVSTSREKKRKGGGGGGGNPEKKRRRNRGEVPFRVESREFRKENREPRVGNIIRTSGYPCTGNTTPEVECARRAPARISCACVPTRRKQAGVAGFKGLNLVSGESSEQKLASMEIEEPYPFGVGFDTIARGKSSLPVIDDERRDGNGRTEIESIESWRAFRNNNKFICIFAYYYPLPIEAIPEGKTS